MDENIFDKINEVDLKKTMETSYIDYAMSVIAARALPDVSITSDRIFLVWSYNRLSYRFCWNDNCLYRQYTKNYR